MEEELQIIVTFDQLYTAMYLMEKTYRVNNPDEDFWNEIEEAATDAALVLWVSMGGEATVQVGE